MDSKSLNTNEMNTADKLAQIARANQQESIDNTCKKCVGVALPSKGFVNQLVSYSDFGNDAGDRGTTQSRSGKATLQDCMKCTSCGHSWIS